MVISYSDLAAWAAMEGLGDYNEVIDQMVVDGILPAHEHTSWALYSGMTNDYEYSELLSDIIDGYVERHGITTVLLQ